MREQHRSVGLREERRREVSALVGKTSVALWIALVTAGSALAFIARGAGPLPGDLLLTHSLQGASFGHLIDSLLIRAGEVVWFLPPLAILVAITGRWWRAAFFISLASVTGLLIPDTIKLLVARPRPKEDLVRVLGPQENYGFPSSTAFLSVVLLGTICYLLWRARPRRGCRARYLAVVDLLEWPLARVRRGALGDGRPRRLAPGGRPPLVDGGIEGRGPTRRRMPARR